MKITLLAAALCAASLAHSATIIDFQDHPPGLDGRSNFNYGGLRFSPSCNIHAGHSSRSDQIWLQSDLDNSNCEAYDSSGEFLPNQLPNRDFLGTGRPNFYIDRFGLPFTLLGLAGVGHVGTEFSVVSSKGGTFSANVPYLCCEPEIPYVLPWEWFALTGPLWTDITWFMLLNAEFGFGWQPHMGWDDIQWCDRCAVPAIDEPTQAVLIGLGGLVLAWVTRRERRRRIG